MIGFIYKIENKVTRMIYVGQCVDWKKRKYRYNTLNCKNQRLIYNSLLKYGLSNHEFTIIEEVDSSLLNEREEFWIEYFQSWFYQYPDKGLNLLKHHKTRLGVPHTQETKDKLSRINKGKIISLETRQKMSKTAKNNTYNCKNVFMFDREGNFIKEFPSLSEAKRITGVHNIGLCLSGKTRKAGGFIWRKDNTFIPEREHKLKTPKHIVDSILKKCLDKNIKKKDIAKEFSVSPSLISKLTRLNK